MFTTAAETLTSVSCRGSKLNHSPQMYCIEAHDIAKIFQTPTGAYADGCWAGGAEGSGSRILARQQWHWQAVREMGKYCGLNSPTEREHQRRLGMRDLSFDWCAAYIEVPELARRFHVKSARPHLKSL